MNLILSAVIPVFLLLLLGNLARRSGFLDEAFWRQAEKGTYYILFPALLITRLSQAEFTWQEQLPLMGAAFLLPVVGAALSLLAQTLLRLKPCDFTSFFQGGIRFNSYIGLALTVTLGSSALSQAALVLAVMIPVVNVLSVTIYSLWSDVRFRWKTVLGGIVKNPLVFGCIVGIFLNITAIPVPSVILATLDKLGLMALPMGLLAVGAGLRVQALRAASAAFLWSSLLKLSVFPLLAYGLSRILQLDPLATSVLMVFAALPTASSSFILARQMKGNADLMAGIITGQTLISMLTLPLVMALLARYFPA